MRRLATLAAASLLATVALTGCATDDEQPGTATDRDLELEELSPTTSPEPFDAGTGEAPTGCSDLSPAPDGRYPVGEAGVVTVTLDDDGEAVVLEDVETADGWEHEVAQEDDVQVDVRFTPDDGASASVALVATLGNDAAGTDQQPEILVQLCEAVA
ncbi:hypothetical protein N866_09955 [Actinotalea ferrariae CF5-4]|mgnify:CR=1 FL=1|uniref:Uncharacterized protein n=1 Tax=Actinotalea ferrariae CF5-4 TaxID=948458 RepID=A0A021VMF8_9CELL|nr:hypothetical protein [Actinotalea ferrariae]EYR62278.1 hypothetical protein N866_09955 [Actinotalea ferrariae CF5-4]